MHSAAGFTGPASWAERPQPAQFVLLRAHRCGARMQCKEFNPLYVKAGVVSIPRTQKIYVFLLFLFDRFRAEKPPPGSRGFAVLSDALFDLPALLEQPPQLVFLAVRDGVSVLGQVLDDLVDLIDKRLPVAQEQFGPHDLVELCDAR